MMNKELFIKSMDILQKYTEWENNLYELGINFWERDEISNLVSNYVHLLEHSCKDDESAIISFFIWDVEFGDKADKYFITEKNGEEIKFYNAEDLWNYLVQQHPEIEDRCE